jgi:hypothetical protein
MSGWLVAFGDIGGLRWVLDHERMAFSEGLALRARGVKSGDELILYVTRGAFHNPTRDQSQLAGLARVTSPVRRLRAPVTIGSREFAETCGIRVVTSLPEREGIPFKPFVERMSFIHRKDAWGQYLRAGLIALPPHDHDVLRDAIMQGAAV